MVVPVALSVTRWTPHERACKSVIKGYLFLFKAVYFFIDNLLQSMIVATILMLLEVFECTGPLGLLLQKCNGTLCLADIPTYVELTKSKLISRKGDIKNG